MQQTLLFSEASALLWAVPPWAVWAVLLLWVVLLTVLLSLAALVHLAALGEKALRLPQLHWQVNHRARAF